MILLDTPINTCLGSHESKSEDTKKIPSAPNKNIGANIIIGQESWCLPYAGLKKKLTFQV